MATNLITREDLHEFRRELLEELKKMLEEQQVLTPKRWFKTYELKRVLPLCNLKLQALRDSGKLPYSRFGKVLIYDYRDIEKLIAEHKVNGIPNASQSPTDRA
jgi:hypothetical protein